METRPLSVFRALFLVASEFRFVKLVFGSFRFFFSCKFSFFKPLSLRLIWLDFFSLFS